jgi:hypothetical protein
MLIMATGTQGSKSFIKLQQILSVFAAWTNTLIDCIRYCSRIKSAEKLRIVGHTDVLVNESVSVQGYQDTTSISNDSLGSAKLCTTCSAFAPEHHRAQPGKPLRLELTTRQCNSFIEVLAGWKAVYWMLYPLISRMSKYSFTSSTLLGLI